MSHPPSSIDFSHLSPSERILLAEHLWDSVSNAQDAPALSLEQNYELRRRLAASNKGELNYAPWQDVKTRLLQPK
jgi:putative addiction module component (TIGR02574 family)